MRRNAARRADEQRWDRRRRGERAFLFAPDGRCAGEAGLDRIYRVNSKGIFNVPYGDMPNQSFYVPDAIWCAHRGLAGAELACEGFELCDDRAEAGDFVYLDPPYPSGLRGETFDPRQVPDRWVQPGRPSPRRRARSAPRPARGSVHAEQRGLRPHARAVRRFPDRHVASAAPCGGHTERRGLAREIVVRNYAGRRDALPFEAEP